MSNPTLHRIIPVAVFAFFVLSAVLHPQSPLRTHELLDTDDYMRLNEVVNWLRSAHPFGAGWFDMSQPRLSPGEHVVVHWARLVDIPIALVMLPLIPFMGMQAAALTASFIVPPLLFIVLITLVIMLAKPLLGARKADLTPVMLLFSPAVILNYTPGRVDHHGYQLIIAALCLLCLHRMIFCERGWKAGIVAAFAFACGLWIGTEALPFVVFFSGCLAVLACLRGSFALRNAGIFGIAFPLAVALIMPIALVPAEWTSRALSWFSGADFIFAALTGGVFIFGWLGGTIFTERGLRLAFVTVLSAIAGLLFIKLVPGLMTGAYADYDAFFNDTLLQNIGEAQPFLLSLHISRYSPESWAHAAVLILHMVFLPCIAAAVIGWNFFRDKSRRRAVWFMHGCFLIPALLMTMFWQVRVGWFAQTLSVVPVTWLVWSMWSIIARRLSGQPRFWAEIAAFCLITLFPTVLLPSMIVEARVYPDLVFFPAARVTSPCPMLRVSELLNDMFGAPPRVILSGANEGPELMFRTPHSVLAAPYNVDGNADAYDFFNARDERKAVNVMLKRHVDLVLVCRTIPPFYAGLASFNKKFNAYLTMGPEGHLRMSSSHEHPTIIERLTDNDTPAWLEPVEIPMDPNYLLFKSKLPN